MLSSWADEMHSFGDIELSKDNDIDPVNFSSYAIFSDMNSFDISEFYNDNMVDVIFSDLTFQRVAGPEQVDQMAAASFLENNVFDLDKEAKDIIEGVSNVAYHEIYAGASPEDACNMENFIFETKEGEVTTIPHMSREALKKTNFYEIYEKLTRNIYNDYNLNLSKMNL